MKDAFFRFLSHISKDPKRLPTPSTTPFSVIQVEDGGTHQALHNLAQCHGATFQEFKDGRAVFIEYGAATQTEHPIRPTDLPVLYMRLAEGREHFQHMKKAGISEVQIPGDLNFRIFSPFGDFQVTKPTDRSSIPGSLGNKPGYFTTRQSVGIDLILTTYSDLINECEKAVRVTQSRGVDLKALPSKITLIPS